MLNDQRHAVIITRPDSADRPEWAELVVRIGPYRGQWSAQNVADQLNATAHQRSRPDGTTVTVAPYDVKLPHRGTLDGAQAGEVMEAILADGDRHGPWSFPDTWDILHTAYGYDEASRLHRNACNDLDYLAEQAEDERQQRQAAEERLRPCRDLIADARADASESVDDDTADRAAVVLADVLDVIERHKVQPIQPRAQLAGAILSTVAASAAA